MNDDKLSGLRDNGILVQKDKDHYIVKIAFTGGNATAEKLRSIAVLAEEFGTGEVHCTTRQGIDIHHIHKNNIFPLIERMKELDLPHASSGKRLRSVIACPGMQTCRFGLGDTQKLAQEIKAEFSSFSDLNCKVKLAVTGCPNGCAKPQENCIGIMAQGNNKWKIFLGGKMGRKPRLGKEYQTVETKEKLFKAIRNILNWMKENGMEKERLSDLLIRLNDNLPDFCS